MARAAASSHKFPTHFPLGGARLFNFAAIFLLPVSYLRAVINIYCRVVKARCYYECSVDRRPTVCCRRLMSHSYHRRRSLELHPDRLSTQTSTVPPAAAAAAAGEGGGGGAGGCDADGRRRRAVDSRRWRDGGRDGETRMCT